MLPLILMVNENSFVTSLFVQQAKTEHPVPVLTARGAVPSWAVLVHLYKSEHKFHKRLMI